MIRFTIFTSCLVAAGCFVGTNGKGGVLLSTKHIDGGVACPTGGNTVSTGPDTNDNGVLDDDEVSGTVTLCDAGAVFQSGVVTGDYRMPGWNLNTGTGERFFEFEVKFPTPFTRPPNVVVGLSDVDAAAPLRLDVEVMSPIEATRFILRLRTWEVSVVSGVQVNWIAYTQ